MAELMALTEFPSPLFAKLKMGILYSYTWRRISNLSYWHSMLFGVQYYRRQESVNYPYASKTSTPTATYEKLCTRPWSVADHR
jgi:hypothetical protein